MSSVAQLLNEASPRLVELSMRLLTILFCYSREDDQSGVVPASRRSGSPVFTAHRWISSSLWATVKPHTIHRLMDKWAGHADVLSSIDSCTRLVYGTESLASVDVSRTVSADPDTEEFEPSEDDEAV